MRRAERQRHVAVTNLGRDLRVPAERFDAENGQERWGPGCPIQSQRPDLGLLSSNVSVGRAPTGMFRYKYRVLGASVLSLNTYHTRGFSVLTPLPAIQLKLRCGPIMSDYNSAKTSAEPSTFTTACLTTAGTTAPGTPEIRAAAPAVTIRGAQRLLEILAANANTTQTSQASTTPGSTVPSPPSGTPNNQ